MRGTVWIVNPYGSLPTEAWATYRSTMLAETLAARGYEVTQFISNFEHRSKTYRQAAPGGIQVRQGYRIELVPAPRYDRHISLARIRYEREYARRLRDATADRPRPDVVVLAEPSLFYYGILLRPLLLRARRGLVLDVIDIWPELFALAIPAPLRPLSKPLLAPFFWWRRRLFRRASAIVATSRDYLSIAAALIERPVPLEVVYWSYDSRPPASSPESVSDVVARLVAAKGPNDIWALYAGTLGDNYDIPAILELARTLPAALRPGISLKVIVAGDGPLAEVCRQASGTDLVFVGRLGAADMAAMFRHADIALATYRGESTVAMPIKAFDYLRHGLPIVNSLGRDLGALVRERHVGLNYAPGSAASLSAAVERLARDAGLRARMSASAKQLAETFAPDRQYAKFADLIDRLPQRLPSTQ